MQQSYETIKKEHPNEWLILGNPVKSKDEQRILATELLYHSPDKLEPVQMDKPLMHEFKRHAICYSVPVFATKYVLVGGRTIATGTQTMNHIHQSNQYTNGLRA